MTNRNARLSVSPKSLIGSGNGRSVPPKRGTGHHGPAAIGRGVEVEGATAARPVPRSALDSRIPPSTAMSPISGR